MAFINNTSRAVSKQVFVGALLICLLPLCAASANAREKAPAGAAQPAFPLDSGSEEIINYPAYGSFIGVGTDKYEYIVKDLKGLQRAAGTGIYPNTDGFLRDPQYKKLLKSKQLDGDPWDFIYSDNAAANFYAWASTNKIAVPAVKQWFTAFALERAGLIRQAIKAYFAIVVHFPQSKDDTFFNTPWYPGRAAVDKIYALCRQNPQLGMSAAGTDVKIINGFNNDADDDIAYVRPGKLVAVSPQDVVPKRKPLKLMTRTGSSGGAHIKIDRYDNNQWQLVVDGKPFVVKGVAYSPHKIGLSPDNGTLNNSKDFQVDDYNGNGKVDGPYDAWVDKNGNDMQDADEPAVGDFQLMKDMGVNCIRVYHHVYNKELMRDLYRRYGIRVLVGDLLGAYAVGSGAAFAAGTDYTDRQQRENMLRSVREMVIENKDEPYVLMWVLGNENNYGIACNAAARPQAYYAFVNEAARLIKKLDPEHPVVLCNGDFLFLDTFAKLCPDVDVYGANCYRGKDGFGLSLWKSVRDFCNKPVLITEYGCPAYHAGKDQPVAEEEQAEYHRLCWEDIMYNTIGSGQGNAIGGVAFEWVDEWWKNGSAANAHVHDATGQFKGPFPDGWLYEEWLGLCAQGNGKNSPFERQLRKVYYMYQQLWK